MKKKPFPIEKYRFEVVGDAVVAHSTYAGKEVVGTAHCAEVDEFDMETGKGIAAARCNVKVCEKRVKRAKSNVAKLTAEMQELSKKLAAQLEYLEDAKCDVKLANRELFKLLQNT